MTRYHLYLALLAVAALFITGCETTSQQAPIDQRARAAMIAAIQSEPLGDYYIGRRYYKEDYKFWGFVRKPRESWASSRMVMLNENQKIAPDREKWQIGSDNGYEYRLKGYFSGDTVYEPASNGFYPEFVLQGMEVINTNPGPIFRVRDATNPKVRVIGTPF